MYIILAITTGALVILSIIANAHLGTRIGIRQGALVNYLVGLLVTTILLVFTSGFGTVIELDYGKLPKYVFLGGVVGVGIVVLMNIVVPKIPTIYTTLLTFIGQIVAGIAIDFITINSLSISKVIGGSLIVMGMAYNSYVDKSDAFKDKEGILDKGNTETDTI